MNATRTARILIEDLPALENLSPEEMAAIVGAGRPKRAPLGFDNAERWDLMAANVMASVVQGVLQIQGTSQADNIKIVEQGNQLSITNNAQAVSIKLENGQSANVISANNLSMIDFDVVGGADQIQFLASGSGAKALPLLVEHANAGTKINVDALGLKFSTNGSSQGNGLVKADSATSNLAALPFADAATAAASLAKMQSLIDSGSSIAVQLGSQFKAKVSVSKNSSGLVTVNFNDVQINVGKFFGSAVDALHQQFTSKLKQIAKTLNGPIFGDSRLAGLTPITILEKVGQLTGDAKYTTAAKQLKALSDTVLKIEGIATKLNSNSTGLWLKVGSFQYQAQAPGGTKFAMLGTAKTDAAFQSSLSKIPGLGDFLKISGLQTNLGDAQVLIGLVSGKATIAPQFSYSYKMDTITLAPPTIRLATFPVGGPFFVTIGIDMNINFAGGVKLGFDLAKFKAGNAKAFSFQEGTLKIGTFVGASGTLSIAELVGLKFAGGPTATVTTKVANGELVTTAPAVKSTSTTSVVAIDLAKLAKQLYNAGAKEVGKLVKELKQYTSHYSQVANALYSSSGLNMTRSQVADALLNKAGVNINSVTKALMGITTGSLSDRLTNVAASLRKAGAYGSNLTNAVGAVANGAEWVDRIYTDGKLATKRIYAGAAKVSTQLFDKLGNVTDYFKYDKAGNLVVNGWKNGSQWIEQNLASNGKKFVVVAEKMWQGSQQLYSKAWNTAGNITKILKWDINGNLTFHAWKDGSQWIEQNLASNGKKFVVVAEKMWEGAQQLYSKTWNTSGKFTDFKKWNKKGEYIFHAFADGSQWVQRTFVTNNAGKLVKVGERVWEGSKMIADKAWDNTGKSLGDFLNRNNPFNGLGRLFG